MSDSIDSPPSSNKVTFLDQSMISEYHEGEVVVLINATYFDEYNGAYAVVTNELHWCDPMDLHTMEHCVSLGYGVEVMQSNDVDFFARSYQIRKLKGDESELLRQPVESEKPELVEA